jgi:hypothetical protein
MNTRRLWWWIAVPAGVILGLLLALGLDRAASPAGAQGNAPGITVGVQQNTINQRIAQAGVRRANRANQRLDQLVPGGGGGGTGGAGPAGPAGPGAERLAFSSAAGGPGRKVLELAGVSITVSCEPGPSGETGIATIVRVEQETTLVGTATGDSGTDPNNPNPPSSNNFQVELPVGQNVSVGGVSASDGQFTRAFASVLFVTRTRTLSLQVFSFADGASDQCSWNGVAVPA